MHPALACRFQLNVVLIWRSDYGRCPSICKFNSFFKALFAFTFKGESIIHNNKIKDGLVSPPMIEFNFNDGTTNLT